MASTIFEGFSGDDTVRVSNESFQYQVKGSVAFPLILEPQVASTTYEQLIEWTSRNKKLVDGLMKRHGGVLFRGFEVTSPQRFNDFVESMGVEALPYVG
jgi:hypothetical protein